MSLFKPDYYISNFQNLDFNRLKKAGIKLLCCDIDNTLVAFNDPDSNRKVHEFIEKAKSNGIDVCLLSNAAPERAKRFSKDLGVEKVYYLSFKPLGHNFKKAMKHFGVTKKQTALIGDQLMTDMLGGHLAGVYTILTAPITDNDKWDTKINRFFENFVYRHWKRKGTFKKGDFDD